MSSVLVENISNLNSKPFQKFIDQISKKKYILLGESTHGTKEYYEVREFITLEICKRKRNVFILFESEWVPLLKINAYIHSKFSDAEKSLDLITDYPLWMVRNKSIIKFLRQLRIFIKHNKKKNINFLGIDCYDIVKSALFIKQFLHNNGIPTDKLEKFFKTIEYIKSGKHSQLFANKLNMKDFNHLSALVHKVLKRLHISEFDELIILQSLNVILSGSMYYLTSQNEKYDHESWNLRDNHWLDTIVRIDKIISMSDKTFILWAHNSHINDIVNSKVEKSKQTNIGSLIRQKFGKSNSALVGFYTSNGTVTASNKWNEPSKLYVLNESKPSSYEYFFHKLANYFKTNRLLITIGDGKNPKNNVTIPKIAETREIGVNYKKNSENSSHYAYTQIAKKYDYVIYIKNTNGVEPL